MGLGKGGGRVGGRSVSESNKYTSKRYTVGRVLGFHLQLTGFLVSTEFIKTPINLIRTRMRY